MTTSTTLKLVTICCNSNLSTIYLLFFLGTIIFVNNPRASSAGTGGKVPYSVMADSTPATTAQSGLAPATLLAAIIPAVLVMCLLLLVVFIFVKRKKQFNKRRKGVL